MKTKAPRPQGLMAVLLCRECHAKVLSYLSDA
jgi:hypothetical protein